MFHTMYVNKWAHTHTNEWLFIYFIWRATCCVQTVKSNSICLFWRGDVQEFIHGRAYFVANGATKQTWRSTYTKIYHCQDFQIKWLLDGATTVAQSAKQCVCVWMCLCFWILLYQWMVVCFLAMPCMLKPITIGVSLNFRKRFQGSSDFCGGYTVNCDVLLVFRIFHFNSFMAFISLSSV